MHDSLSVEILAKLEGAFDIKAVFPQLSIDRATNPQVHPTTENLSVSNSIFLHNVLGLSGACLINFIYSSARQSDPSCFSISISSSSFFISSSPPPSGPGQRNTFRRSRGQAAVDEEEEVEAGQCCGSKGRPLSQVYDQSQVYRCLHPQYVRERSCGHNGPRSGKVMGQ